MMPGSTTTTGRSTAPMPRVAATPAASSVVNRSGRSRKAVLPAGSGSVSQSRSALRVSRLAK